MLLYYYYLIIFSRTSEDVYRCIHDPILVPNKTYSSSSYKYTKLPKNNQKQLTNNKKIFI